MSRNHERDQPLAAVARLCPRYHQAVELIGRRWSGAVISVLMGGERRFNELLGSIPGISDRLLTERLRELEKASIVTRQVHAGSPVRVVYRLTERGEELQETIASLERWAERWIAPSISEPV